MIISKSTTEFTLDSVKEKVKAYGEKHPTVWFKNPLSIKIMEDKYLHSDEKTVEEFLFRVCNIFIGDDMKWSVFDLMLKGSFFPGGRSLYGAGSKGKFNATMSNCFVAGTKVTTTTGVKNIEDIKIGDMVYTSKGAHKVTRVVQREYEGDLYRLQSKNFDYHNEIICTPNHEFLTAEGWLSAEKILLDYLNYGKIVQMVAVKNDPAIRGGKNYAVLDAAIILENQKTIVYNLTVEDVHEYNVNGVICHNCYILPNPGDSLEEIYESNKEISRIFKAGGGIGVNLSTLRPNGAKTNNAARTSTGAVSFVHLYNTTGSIIGFHGRRGATLIGLDISHPDIEEFIDLRSKYDLSAMNISCLITDDFMEAVKNKEKFKLHFHVDATGEDIEREVDAAGLYHKICQMNWDYGDPGMLFKTTVDKHNFMEYEPKFKIDICNPCAEYTGPAYNSCNLGSMNLYNYVKNPFTKEAKFDLPVFARDVQIATAALDEILDYGYDLQPLDENRRVISEWRAIGLGYFGFADALVALGIPYGSKESVEMAEIITKCLTKAAIDESSRRAQALGSFKNFVKTHVVKSSLLKELGAANMVKTRGLRNAQLISIAPTGSLSLLAGSLSSGIEPIFQCQYDRSTHGLEDQKVSFTVSDRAIMDLLKFHNIEPGSISTEEIKERFPFVVEAADIDPLDRVEVQAAMQKYLDNAISSTVNLPESATVEDIENIYMKAWESGLKGITVFRDNCKRASILGFKKDKDKNDRSEEEKKECTCKCKENKMNSIVPISRKGKGPLSGRTYRKRTACVKALYVTINRDEDGNIFEVFTNKSTHGCSANIATITRMTSLSLRSGVEVETIIKELKENSCQACQQLIKAGQKDVSLSCPYAIGEALEEEYKSLTESKTDIQTKVKEVQEKVEELKTAIAVKKKIDEVSQVVSEAVKNAKTIEGEPLIKKTKKSAPTALECPECGERTLIVEGKCTSCKRCGYSKCD